MSIAGEPIKLDVLIVEDNAFMRSVLAKVLRSFIVGRIGQAANGDEALEALRAGFRPDLVITDWEMQPINGLELARRIRRGEAGIDATTPVIMLSACANDGRAPLARDGGVNAFLAKPVSPSALLETIIEVTENPRPFIRGKSYTGPCRRRAARKFAGRERRRRSG